MILCVIFWGLVIQTWAQSLPDKVLGQPAKYNRPYSSNDIAPVDRADRLQSKWTVFSDRDQNTTFTAPENGRRFKRLAFMEKFYVCDEKGDWVRIVKDPEIKRMDLSGQAVDYGWVQKSHLLLWKRCLVTKKSNINKKAMILNTIDQLRQTRGAQPDIVEFQSSPAPEGNKTGKKSKLFEILFIFKDIDANHDGEADYYLLSRSSRMPEGNIDARRNTILGWAPKARLTFWDHRIALEPNWEKVAVQERKNKYKKAKFFADQPAAIFYKKGLDVDNRRVVWDNDPLGERPIGEWRRFPILKEFRNGTISAGVMGEIFSAQGSQMNITPEELAFIQRKLDDLEAKRRNINMVFVIDGTNSMGPYFPALSKAVQQSMKELGRQRTNNVFRFGAVIYRDWAEGRDRLTEVAALGSDVVSFLQNAEARDLHDRDTPEAVFFGLYEALRGTGLTQNETNIIVLIGDAGNHNRQDGSQQDPQAIINALTRFNAYFLAFQVHHESHPSYNDFIDQTKDLILNTASNVYSQNKAMARALGNRLEAPYWDDSNQPSYILKGGTYYGRVFGLNQGQKLNPNNLASKIEDFIGYINQRNDQLIAAIEEIKNGGAFSNVNQTQQGKGSKFKDFASPLASGIIEFLKQSGLTEDQIKIAQTEKYQVYLRASTTLTVKGMKHPLFKKVLFLSRRELGKLLDTMYDLADQTSGQGLREALVKNWKRIIQSVEGGITDAQLENMSMEKLNKLVMGIPPSSEFIRNLTLKELLDPSKIDDTKIGAYFEEIDTKAKKLSRIFNTDSEYKYSFRSNEVRYFWIPVEMLP